MAAPLVKMKVGGHSQPREEYQRSLPLAGTDGESRAATLSARAGAVWREEAEVELERVGKKYPNPEL